MRENNKSSDRARIKNITRDVRSNGKKRSRSAAGGRRSTRSQEELFARPVKKSSRQLHQESLERRRRMRQQKKRRRILTILAACIVVAALIPTLIVLGNFNSGNRHDQKGLSAYEAGDYETAVSEFKEALTFDDQSAVYYDHLGMAYTELKSYDEARGYFNQADACAQTDAEKIMISRDRGIACLYQGSYENAIDAFSRALGIEGADDGLTADILFYKADAEKKLGDYTAAIDSYTRIIELKDDAAARSLRGHTYMMQEDYSQAETDLYAAIKLERKNYSDYLSLYEALIAQNKQEDAQEVLNDALSISGSSGEDQFINGCIYLKLNDLENARAAFDASYAKHYTGALAGMAQLMMQQDETDQAIAYFEQFFQEADEKTAGSSLAAKACNQYAMCLIGKGDYDKAVSICEQGLQINDLEAEKTLMFNLITAYENTGAWTEAYNTAKTYVAKYPDDEAGQKEFTFLESRAGG